LLVSAFQLLTLLFLVTNLEDDKVQSLQKKKEYRIEYILS